MKVLLIRKKRKRNTGHQSHKPYGTSASNWVLERKLVQPLRGTSQDMTLVEEMVYQLSQAFPQTPNFSFGFANIIWHFESSWVFFTLIKKN